MARDKDQDKNKKHKNCSFCVDKIVDFKRQLKLNDSILRIMFLEVAKNAVAR